MPCDTQRLTPEQTLQQRKDQIKRSVESLDRGLLRKKIKPVVGPQGAITFVGWEDKDRNRITDACAYRRIMSTGSALARSEIARAEQLAGRGVDRMVVGQGIHSHDGGVNWHPRG